MTATALSAEQLCSRCAPESLGLDAAAEPLPLVGQSRAAEAIAFALAMRRPGYHLFVSGPPGSGRRSLVRAAVAAEVARSGLQRSDYVYVNNFSAPHKPIALALPAGRGAHLKADMQSLVRDLRTMIRTTFESEEYASEQERINAEFKERAEQAFLEVNEEAQRRGLAMVRTPVGITVAPQRDGQVMTPEAFEQLPADERDTLQRSMAEVQEQLVKVLRASMRLRKEHADRIRELDRSMTALAIDHPIDDVRECYADLPAVARWIDAVHADVIEHVDAFRPADEEAQPPGAEPRSDVGRYEVNVVLDASAADGTPIVEADLPTHQNLVGRVDHVAQFGMLVTDFRMIKAGLLHRANGGTLLIDAVKLLGQPFAWASLKRALDRGEIRIESTPEVAGMISTLQIEPEPIPLDVKVVLVGDRQVCALLQAYDPEFDQLFRIVADLDDDMPRATAQSALARSLAAQAREHQLLPVSADGLARVVEHAARLADDGTRLSARVGELLDLLLEADLLVRQRAPAGNGAAAAGATAGETIDAAAIGAAIDARRLRAARADERLRDAVLRDILAIATAGRRIGQLNGLSVYEVGRERFGAVMRITATTRLGAGEVIDVQRETRLGGPIHAKGVMILSSFLAARYSRMQPHSIHASLVFEQTYGMVEGDSASLAETLALLSSIGEVPLAQSLAVTGSVDQFGSVQAIGGVNEKIEGFFDICAARGLDGTHGVLIPRANVAHLMLRADVVDAVATGRFAVHAVDDVDDALALMSGLPAGDPAQPARDTVNGRIVARLREFTKIRRGEPRLHTVSGRGTQRGAATRGNGENGA